MNLFNTPLLFPVRFLVLLSLLATAGCQKERSFEAGVPGGGGGATGGSAVFKLLPSGTKCSDAAVSGSFVAGTSLGLGATLTVTVDVSQTGDWVYSTSLVNGFVFAGSGDFTVKGAQSIVLQAAGKPTAAGNFDFTLNMGGTTCSVKVTVDATGSNNGDLGDYYYKATIGGVSYAQGVTMTNDFEPGAGMGGTDDVVFGAGINYMNPPLPAGLTEFGIDKGMMHNYVASSLADFKAFFAPGDYPYAPLSYSSGNGVTLYWTDKKGEVWTTRNGTVDQIGSTFKIISATDDPDVLGRYYLKVKALFTCKLYNQTTGAMLQLTNGEAVLAFGRL